jgi:putative nucleotidyltransferase with HDIG domain
MANDVIHTQTKTAGKNTVPNEQRILLRLRNCQRLPSLGSVNSALRELLGAEQRYTSQIAEVIRRDPSLTARLLRLVNSVYYGLTTPINGIEEAVFYLGVRQIRQLAMVTPIVEDFQKLAGNTPFDWRSFWQHCIGTAILTREVISSFQSLNDEADYVAGLIHDVGKIAMAAAFPEEFQQLQEMQKDSTEDLLSLEKQLIGVDHTELGAIYLQQHSLPPVLVEAVRWHHQPEKAGEYAPLVAAVQIADLLCRQAGIGNSGNAKPVTQEDWMSASGWTILSTHQSETEKSIARANLKRSLERLPSLLEGLV